MIAWLELMRDVAINEPVTHPLPLILESRENKKVRKRALKTKTIPKKKKYVSILLLYWLF